MKTVYLSIPGECANDVMEVLKGYMYGLVKRGQYDEISELSFILKMNEREIKGVDE